MAIVGFDALLSFMHKTFHHKTAITAPVAGGRGDGMTRSAVSKKMFGHCRLRDESGTAFNKVEEIRARSNAGTHLAIDGFSVHC